MGLKNPWASHHLYRGSSTLAKSYCVAISPASLSTEGGRTLVWLPAAGGADWVVAKRAHAFRLFINPLVGRRKAEEEEGEEGEEEGEEEEEDGLLREEEGKEEEKEEEERKAALLLRVHARPPPVVEAAAATPALRLAEERRKRKAVVMVVVSRSPCLLAGARKGMCVGLGLGGEEGREEVKSSACRVCLPQPDALGAPHTQV